MTHYLPIGHTIKNHACSTEYTIKKVLGRGSSTIAYLATSSDGTEHILKEYYPIGLGVTRHLDGALCYSENDAEKFDEGLWRFIESSDRQNNLRRRTYLKNGIPPLCQKFNSNKTCYLDVTPFEGQPFDKIATYSLLDRLQICLTTAKMIKRLHVDGMLFLDIKPENIFVLTDFDGEIVRDLVVLVDFDSVIERDKVSFGNSISFTEDWAAPEQIDPYGFERIAEATDVYAIGELVFWTVFGRHSLAEEHRGFSSYPFENLSETQVNSSNRKTVTSLLTKLFRKTLRSSVRNRFASIDPVVSILDEIVGELSKKERIVTAEIRLNNMFVGRQKELVEIENALNLNDMVFLSGIAGIGKSELVKQYIRLLKDGVTSSDSVFAHVEKVFSMKFIPEDQISVLAKLAFMPIEGVTANKFYSFFSLGTYNGVNELINHGWIRSGDDHLSVHPTIASVVIEHVKRKPELLKKLLEENYKAIKIWKSKEFVETE